jgi:hypothetical protein
MANPKLDPESAKGVRSPKSVAVKPKRAEIVCRVAIAFSLASLGLASVAAQSGGDRPDKVFWPGEVKISEEIKLEQKTKYGLVTSKQSPGAVVKVVGSDSDLLRVESGGFLGTVRIERTDFWERAERARITALEREKREKAAKERQEREAQAIEPRASRKTVETYKPELLIGMTREQMLALMGQPIELKTGSHSIDGGYKIYSYSKEKGKETYFTIWDDDGVIDNGMYQGVYFFKK